MRIGIFGGTFNPVHNGHVQAVARTISCASLDQVLVIPTAVPPHKAAAGMAEGRHRLQMCRLAFAEMPKVKILDLEIKRGGPSYTVVTLQDLRVRYPDDELFLVMGADMFLTFEQWVQFETIMAAVSFCVLPRNAAEQSEIHAYAVHLSLPAHKLLFIPMPETPLSSSDIRADFASGKCPRDKMPARVTSYICEHGLYTQSS